jgi:hypothetical protein
MRPAAQVALGCAVSVGLGAAALAALVFVAVVSGPDTTGPVVPEGRPDRPEPSPTPLPEAFAPRVGSASEFKREETEGAWRLTYGFIDHHGRRHRVTCAVQRADLDSERRAFGYVEEDIKAEHNRRLKRMVDREVAVRGLTPYFKIRFYGWGGHEWSWNIPGEADAHERGRAEGEIVALERWLKGGFLRERDEVLAGVYKPRGILLRNNQLAIDYTTVAERGVTGTTDCFEALRRAGAGSTLRQYLGLFVAFFQELKYEIPPAVENGKEQHGLWVPSDVLVRGKGDCDSKSAAFAAMWSHMPTALLFITLPKHVLVAVEAPPWPGEHFVRLGNRTFLFGEVAGEAKIRPGFAPPEGNYEYVLFEPAGRR